MEKILKNKKILVGITGSIAAYKSPLLIRELVKLGADVHAILTPSAVNFIAPMTLANLTKNRVLVEMFDESAQSGGAWHIELVHSCDLMIIAPCSASTLGKIANGICDNSLVTLAVALPQNIPFLVAPAMDYSMLQHPSTKRNINQIKSYNGIIIPPEDGELSSGLVGPGRLPDTEVLLTEILKALNIPKPSGTIKTSELKNQKPKLDELLKNSSFTLMDAVDKDKWTAELEFSRLKQSMGLEETFNLSRKKVLITAGPTHEQIDDVRFIGNNSSGKMGFALAEAALNLGAEVTLVTGPVELSSNPKIKRFDVISAEEMFKATEEHFQGKDIAIFAAAVADFTPVSKFKGKLKKEAVGENYTIELKKTVDILATLSAAKTKQQLVIGFALESANEIENGWKKMKDKACDMIVVNSANKSDSGFGGDNNTITILTRDGKELAYPPMSKELCGLNILKIASDLLPK